MNKNCYRVIFSKIRKAFIVVAENVNAHGKAKNKTRMRTGKKTARNLLLLILNTSLIANAQIIADPNAPLNQQPTILSDALGRPLVNIQTPTSSGLSRNTYTQFDVGVIGAVLNNSRFSNPWLAGGEASTILNEVNSNNPSYLNGIVTVNGSPAQVIIANPKGLQINGGGFVNASRATLTTGSPIINNGQLEGFDVRGGQITIGANGMNNSQTPYTDLLSRVVAINGRVDANQIDITTGLQTIHYTTGELSNINTEQQLNRPSNGTGIDTQQLGGLYGNKITLLATEKGLGVNNRGVWQASGGAILVTADGEIKNQGSIDADITSLATIKGSIANYNGRIHGTNLLAINSNYQLNGFYDELSTQGDILISAANINFSNTNIRNTGIDGQIAINGNATINNSKITSNGPIKLIGYENALITGSTLQSNNSSATILMGRDLSLLGRTIISGKKVYLEVGSPFTQAESPKITIGLASINSTESTELISWGDLYFKNLGMLGTQINSGGSINMQAYNVYASNQVKIDAGKNITIDARNQVDLNYPVTVRNDNDITMNGIFTYYPTQLTQINAGGKISINADGNLSAHGSRITAGDNIEMISAQGNIGLQTLIGKDGKSYASTQLQTQKDITVSAYNGDINATALNANAHNISLMSNGQTRIAQANNKIGNTIQAISSELNAQNDLTIGSINSAKKVEIIGAKLNAGAKANIIAAGDLELTSAKQQNESNGMITPAASVGNQITAGNIDIQGKSIRSEASNIQTTAGDLNLYAIAGELNLNPDGIQTNQGNILNAQGNLTLYAQNNLNQYNSQISALGHLKNISDQGNVKLQNVQQSAGKTLSIKSQQGQTLNDSHILANAVSLYNANQTLELKNSRLQSTVDTTPIPINTASAQTIEDPLNGLNPYVLYKMQNMKDKTDRFIEEMKKSRTS